MAKRDKQEERKNIRLGVEIRIFILKENNKNKWKIEIGNKNG